MNDDAPRFDDAGRLTAPRYGDVYFSADDGLAETRYVFLEGNQLAQRFAAMRPGQRFTIGETGFGTGLNFLAAWQLFEQHAPAETFLEFVSIEMQPLDRAMMRQAIAPWPELAPFCEALIAQWGPIWQGMHRFSFAEGRVRLTLGVGEVAEALAGMDAWVDAWFLDGFAPSRNPAMWSDAVFKNIARQSGPGTTLATYTAAGFVRRGLQAVGFEIQKRPGFARKRDMTAGHYLGGRGSERAESTRASQTRPEPRPPDQPHAVVIGGSLAGSFVAHALAERGVSVTVIERQGLVGGEWPALSPRIAVLQPKINDANDLPGQALREGYARVERRLSTQWGEDGRIAWQACGTFHAAVNERAERRLRRFADQFGPNGLSRWIDAADTEDELGLALPVGGVVIDRAGVLRPAGLCAALLDHPQITVRDTVDAQTIQTKGKTWCVSLGDQESIESSVVVVANAWDAHRFDQTKHLELRPVRGQATLLDSVHQAETLKGLRRAIFYGGYLTAAVKGIQMLGASFVPGDTDLTWRSEEHVVVCDQLARVLPDEAQRLKAFNDPTGWVGLRMTTPTQHAHAAQVDEGLYVSLGHGSHGIASAANAGEHLACMITEGPRRQSATVTT